MKAKKIWCRHGNFSNLEQRKSSKFQTQHSDFHWWHMAKLTNAWGFCHSFYPHFATNKKSYFFTCFRLAYETNSKQLTSSNPILTFRLDLLKGCSCFFPFSHWLWNLLQYYFTETFSFRWFPWRFLVCPLPIQKHRGAVFHHTVDGRNPPLSMGFSTLEF